MHGTQVIHRIEQRLALAGRRGTNVEVDHIGRQALGGNLESGAGARAVLEEDIEHRFAVQQRDFFDLAPFGGTYEFGSLVQDVAQNAHRQAVGGQQVLKLAVTV